jgi:hypothetical protein
MGVSGVFNQMGHTPMTFSFKRAPIVLAAVLSLQLSAGLAVPALAQDQQPAAPAAQPQEVSPEALELARKYIDLTDHGGIYETTIVRAGINTYQQLLPQNPEIAEPLNKAIETVIASYKDRKGDLFDQMARLYALAFTQDELQQIVDFYATPTGQKLSKANAELNPALQRIMNVFSVNLSKEFFAKVRAELKAQGIDT